MIEVPGVGERGSRQLSRQTLAEVIEPRVEELYSLVQAELRRSGYEELLSSGVVITGGCSAMQGMVELGEEIFPHAGAHRAFPTTRADSRRWCATRAFPPGSVCSSSACNNNSGGSCAKLQIGIVPVGPGEDEELVHGKLLSSVATRLVKESSSMEMTGLDRSLGGD